MSEQKQLEARLLAGFLVAAQAMGSELKTLSWFGRNHAIAAIWAAVQKLRERSG